MEKEDFERSRVGIGGSTESCVSRDDLNVRVEDLDFNDFDLCELLLDINLPFLLLVSKVDSHFHPSYLAFLRLAFFVLVKWVDLHLSQP
jgi:hypothetical protein